jgi:3',5'-cyclic AMP phosphodiesterase CpdA
MTRRAATALSTALLLALAACGDEGTQGDGSRPAAAAPPPRAAGVTGPTLVAAGDIACPPGLSATRTRCRQAATADVIERLDPDVVAPLGDLQYDKGELANFRRVYAPAWGRFRARSRPAAGNHEYATPGAAGYFSYFGARAGARGRGWYSYDLGDWHVVVLNSNCSKVGCRAGSAQERWLRADLARHRADCTLAYWHHPRFSSGLHGNDATVIPLWRALERAGADVVLSGHDHSYERFGPQTATGRASHSGMVQFVAGTGGVNNYPVVRRRPNSRVRRSFVFGVLELTLGDGAYGWRFVGVPGLTFADRGSARCR